MKLVSKALLYVAKWVPVGYWRIIKFAASRDSSLWDYPLPLKCCPDYSLRADLRESVYAGIFRTGSIPHQQGFDKVCKRILRKGDVVFDVGSNVGYTTMFFSWLVGGGKVVSIEPVPRSFELLRRTCEAGKLNNVRCLNVAAASMPGKVKIFVTDMLDRSSAIEICGSEMVIVSAVSLDLLASEYGLPRLVKIDVEGFESQVIEGMKNILGQEDSPIIIYEALSGDCRLRSRELIERYAINQYSFYRIGNDGDIVSFDEQNGSSDYLAMPEWAHARLN